MQAFLLLNNLLFPAIALQRFRQRQFQVVFIPGFGDVAVKIRHIDGVAHVLRIRLSGQKNFQRVWMAAMNRGKQRVPFHAGHDLIRNHDRHFHALAQPFFDHFKRVLAIFGGFDKIILPKIMRQLIRKAGQHQMFIIHA